MKISWAKKATSLPVFFVILLFVALGTIVWVGRSTADDDQATRAERAEDQFLPVVKRSGESSVDEPDQQVVIAYYSDDSQLTVLAQYTDLHESGLNKEDRYASVITTAQERAELEAAGFRLQVDREQTEQMQLALADESRTIPGYACYRTVEETYATGELLAATYPTLATWIDIGDSWRKADGSGGYDIMVLKITNSAITGDKPALFAQSAVHSREYTPAELNTRFAEHILSNYGIDPDITWIVDHHELHLLLLGNPDGRKVAEGGLLHRKTANVNACGGDTYYQSSSTHGGIDLNRNYSFNWGACNNESCSSSNTCSATYRGTSGASEPETQAIENYLLNNFPDHRDAALNAPVAVDAPNIFFDLHSFGELMLYPWSDGTNNTANNAEFITLGRKLAFFNNHTNQRADQLYPTDGSGKDFAYGELGMAAFTVELGTAFFQDCATFESSIYPTNLDMMVYAAKLARAPYMLPAGPEAYGVVLDNAIVAPGTSVQLSATLDDTRFNANNGTEATQTVVAAEYYFNTPPWESGATAVPMTASDGSFNAGNEIATSTIDTTNLPLGKHTIYVRGQDSLGNWGVVSAVFLELTDNPPTTLFNDNFETDQGWTTDPTGSDTATTGQWERANPESTASSGVSLQLDATVSGSNALITEGTAGSSAGTNDIDNGVTSIRSPNITIPAGATDASLSFWSYLGHLDNADANDYLRVRVVGNTTQTVLNETGNGAARPANWAQTTVDISSFAGETVYLLIDAADNGGGSLVEAAVDDVLVTALVGASPTPTNTPVNTATPVTTTTPQPTNTPTATNTPLPPTATNTPPPPTATNTPLPPTPTTPASVTCTTHNSSNVPVALPNGTSSVNSSLSINSGGIIQDVNVNVDMSHVWVGDLSFSLSHNGTDVVIVDRPGVPASQWGCSGDNILATLDDEAATSIEGQCAGSTPTINGSFQPTNALAAFDGVSEDGTWTLNVADAYTSADAGTLNDWSLEICTISDGTPPPTNTPPPTSTPLPPTATPPPAGCQTISSSDTPISLPNGTASISSALLVNGSSTISDVNVSVDMDHAWSGDLTFTLAHDGTSVTLIDRPGIPGSTWGCSNDDILATLDDEAAAAVESQCAAGSPAINGTFSPNGSLSDFGGGNGNGTWTLTVVDAYTSADAGTLNGWSLEICTEP